MNNRIAQSLLIIWIQELSDDARSNIQPFIKISTSLPLVTLDDKRSLVDVNVKVNKKIDDVPHAPPTNRRILLQPTTNNTNPSNVEEVVKQLKRYINVWKFKTRIASLMNMKSEREVCPMGVGMWVWVYLHENSIENSENFLLRNITRLGLGCNQLELGPSIWIMH